MKTGLQKTNIYVVDDPQRGGVQPVPLQDICGLQAKCRDRCAAGRWPIHRTYRLGGALHVRVHRRYEGGQRTYDLVIALRYQR